MSKKQIKVLIPLGALLLTIVVLAGCRPSETLTQLMNAMNALNPSTEEMKTEDEENESEPDDQMDPIDESRDDAQIEVTEELIGQMLENMDWETAQESLMAVYSASAASGEWGAQQYNPDRLTYGSGGALVLNVSGDEVNSASKIAGNGEGNGSGEASVIEATGERDYDDNPEAVETELPRQPQDTTVSSEEPREPGESDSNDTKEELPGDGETENSEVPAPEESEDTEEPQPTYDNAGYRIAASGELAVVVCMLGGADRLCASSQDFYNNELAQEAYGSKLTEDMKECGWRLPDDGTYMTDAQCEQFMQEVQPDIVFDINHTSFSSEQEKIINKYGKYKSVTAMTSEDGVRNCLYDVADEMGNGARDFVDGTYYPWINENVTKSMHISTTAETIFIEDWDTDARLTDAYGNTLANGAAVIKIGPGFRALSDYLIDAKVYDWAVAPHQRGSNVIKTGIGEYGYALGDSNYNGTSSWFSGAEGVAGYTKPGALCYVTPVYDELDAAGNGSGELQISGKYEIIDNSSASKASKILSYGYLCLGYSDSFSKWTTVIAKNQDVANNMKNDIRQNGAWSTNASSGSAYNSPKYTTGSSSITVNYLCTPLTLNGVSRYSSIGGQYVEFDGTNSVTSGGEWTILVNPSGMGNWVEGSPESILETCWAAEFIQGYKGPGFTRQMIHDFYRDIYGLELDLYGTEINNILNGVYSS